MRTCGDCTACCKIMGVPELHKEAGEQCKFCIPGGGCFMYRDRPMSCREFECLWLQNPSIPEELRPDKSGVVVFEPGDDPGHFHVQVDPHRPGSIEKVGVSWLMRSILKEGHRVTAHIKDETFEVLKP